MNFSLSLRRSRNHPSRSHRQLYGADGDSPTSQITKDDYHIRNLDDLGAEINHCSVSIRQQGKENATVLNAADDDQYYLQCITKAHEDLWAQAVGPNGHANNILRIETQEEAYYKEICSNEEAALVDLERAYTDYEAVSASWF